MIFGENHGIGCSHEIQNLHINPADSEFQIPLARYSTGLQISAPGIPLDSGILGSPYLEFHWTPHSGPGIPPDSGIPGSPYPEFHWTPHSGPGIPPDSGIPCSTYPEFHRIPPGILPGPGIPLEFHWNSGPFFTRDTKLKTVDSSTLKCPAMPELNSLYTLAEMFDLPPSVVHSTISKMIINEELQASWDEPTQTVVMHRGAEPSLLQSLALQLADKVSNLVENNERIYDTRHGGFVQFKDRQGQGRQNQQHYNRQDRPEKQDRQDRYNWQERYGRQHDRSYQKSQSSY
ncbi:hypothetical protein ACROYT_G009391 [Oculina patagonica]